MRKEWRARPWDLPASPSTRRSAISDASPQPGADSRRCTAGRAVMGGEPVCDPTRNRSEPAQMRAPPQGAPVRRPAVLLTATTVVAGLVPAAALADRDHTNKPAIYLVGGAAESISPTAAMLANNDFYLGGFGFASGHPGNVTALPSAVGDRHATGILDDPADNDAYPAGYGPGDGVHSRSLAVSDGTSTIVLAQIET